MFSVNKSFDYDLRVVLKVFVCPASQKTYEKNFKNFTSCFYRVFLTNFILYVISTYLNFIILLTKMYIIWINCTKLNPNAFLNNLNVWLSMYLLRCPQVCANIWSRKKMQCASLIFYTSHTGFNNALTQKTSFF